LNERTTSIATRLPLHSAHRAPQAVMPTKQPLRAAEKIGVVLTIVLGHLGFFYLLSPGMVEVRRLHADPQPISAQLISADDAPAIYDEPSLATADPLVEMEPPTLPSDAILEPQVEAPRIDPDSRIRIEPFAAQAQLPPGQVATVILTLQISADGSVMSAEVVRSTGTAAVNSAAIDYARATRWIPGFIDGEARAMQASLTVILGETV
jgi:TonB family protein